MAAYAEPHRRYHTTQHLQELFALVDALHGVPGTTAELELALWFHDASYDPRRTDNEEQSAAWARSELLNAGLSLERVQQVSELILATKHADSPASGTEAQLLVDIDLSILGARAERFAEYEQQVREEYSWVPELSFRSARRDLLARFLARPTLYATDACRVRFEHQARLNLTAALAALAEPSEEAMS
jgi:predicted metal-dependent HD superfamily phosphohydrolase